MRQAGSAAALAQSGLGLIVAVALVVTLALAASYFMARWLGLDERLATLVACGNSICGNSAIMATAPVIDAPAADVAASFAFTAALGIVVVLLLPLAFGALGLTQWPLQQAASQLTLVSMAALGLSVDLRAVLSSGGRVLAAGSISIVVLVALAVATAVLLGGA